MKKTFRFLSMAALLLVGAIMTGCSNDDNIDNPQQPANKNNVVTLKGTVSLDANAGTRAIDGTTGAKTFESGKQIAVIYTNTSSETVKAVSTDFTPTGDNTKATFTVSLTNPADNSAIRYIYPATMAKDVATDATITDDDATIDYSGIFGSQDGTLTKLADYDLAVKDAALSGTDLPVSVTLANPLAICKFAFVTGESLVMTDITGDVTSLTICDCTNTYVVTPSSLSDIYVAMKPVSGNISFAATTATNTYFKTKTGATLAASTLYTDITVSMVDAADLIMAPAVGQVIGNDGKNYADATAASSAGATAVAKIVYVGSDNGEAAPYNHGLALALSDANGGSRCMWSTSNTKVHTYNAPDESFASESGLQYITHNSDTYPAFKAAIANNGTAAPTGCSSWFLASGYQWQKMISAAGGSNNLGLTEYEYYWSSTEGSADTAWMFNSDGGYWLGVGKGNFNLVRACLAF